MTRLSDFFFPLNITKRLGRQTRNRRWSSSVLNASQNVERSNVGCTCHPQPGLKTQASHHRSRRSRREPKFCTHCASSRCYKFHLRCSRSRMKCCWRLTFGRLPLASVCHWWQETLMIKAEFSQLRHKTKKIKCQTWKVQSGWSQWGFTRKVSSVFTHTRLLILQLVTDYNRGNNSIGLLIHQSQKKPWWLYSRRSRFQTCNEAAILFRQSRLSPKHLQLPKQFDFRRRNRDIISRLGKQADVKTTRVHVGSAASPSVESRRQHASGDQRAPPLLPHEWFMFSVSGVF